MWRWLSETVDDVAVVATHLFGPRMFRASAPVAPPALETLVAEQRALPPRLKLPLRLERRVGRLRLELPAVGIETHADFHPARRADADTLVVYHHGLGEFPHDGSAGQVLTRGGLRERVDWIAIRGPNHESREAIHERLLLSQESFARNLLSSVFGAREIATRLRDRYRHVVLGGMSMGGVISLIEAACGGSAFDLHVPLMAGPDLESVLLRSAFTRAVCPRFKRRCLEEGDGLGARLDLVARLRDGAGPPIRAVLASYDRLFRIDAQGAAYAQVPRARYSVLSGGHITAAVQFTALAARFEEAIERELWSRRPALAAVA